MPISTDGFGTIISTLEAGIGGGGGTVIPPGGNISGSYPGSVLCQGNVTVTGALVVNGTLLVIGDLTNSGGYAMTIRGDFFVGNVNLDPTTPGSPQGTIDVKGDLLFGNAFNFRQDSGGAPADLYVGGDFMGTLGGGGTGSVLAAGGADGSSGAHVYVNGSLLVYSIDVRGAPSSTVGLAAGNGGEITVYGNVTVQDALWAHGGDGTNTDGGNGGIVNVWGDVNSGDGSWNVHGGDGNTGNAGNGGSIYVHSNASIQTVYLYGGQCTSDSHLHRSGNGGNTEIDGNFVCDSLYNARGGDRFGNLALGNGLPPPNGGTLNVYGTASFDDVFMEGGDTNTSSFPAHPAGQGGGVNVDGNMSVADDFQLNGGNAFIGLAGNGGSVTVQGHLFVDDDLEVRGGNSSNGDGGNGGNVYVYGNLQTGDSTLYGGTGNEGNGGEGGLIDARGHLTVDSYLDAYGGACVSSVDLHRAGSGGTIFCRNLDAGGHDINISGGSRSGNTTTLTANFTPNGGLITTRGHLICSNIYGEGGVVSTTFPNGAGGNGATINVSGDLIVTGNVTVNGGGSVGVSGGGSGGSVTVTANTKVSTFVGNGGDCNDSIGIGGDAGRNGSGGNGYFQGGLVCSLYQVFDGAGAGTAAVGAVEFYLGGYVTVGSINMTDRPGCVIRTYGSGAPAMVKVGAMVGKTTFNNHANTATGDLSARLGDSLLISDSAGGWYYTQGTAI